MVTGIGLLCALGESLWTSWSRLIAGESAIALHHPFPELPPTPLAPISASPTPLAPLTETTIATALKDANLVPPLPDCAVAIGSSRSHQGRWEQLARQFDRHPNPPRESLIPDNWLDTLPHMPAIATARSLGSTGPVFAPMAACATGIWAIAQGVQLIQSGHCQRAIVGAVEAPITPLTLAGFAKMGALAKTGCYPFDRDRQGLVLGEGAAAFVLESAELAHQRGAKIYGKILSFGLTNDACYGNAPDQSGTAAIAAILQSLTRAHLSPSDIDYIHAHGTSTQLNDCTEARIIQHLFPPGVPVSSTKGATGHALGASGALGTAFCLMAFHQGHLPPCVGLQNPAFDLDFVTTSRRTNPERVLCFSFGFGGQNAVLALGK